MPIEFTRHIFATLTYSRDIEVLSRWNSCSKDYNRFVQKFRRLHNCQVEYFRVVEEHKDSFPHIHALLQFPDARIRIENHRFFDSTLYKKWKSNWTHGHSDYQKPRNGSQGAIPYLMKYLLKNQTSKTIWRKILAQESQSMKSVVETPIINAQNVEPVNGLNVSVTESYPTHLNGVKLASWSRNFQWEPLKPKFPK